MFLEKGCPGTGSYFFVPIPCSFVLKQKNQKFKALTSFATKYKPRLNHLNSLALKQQMILNASTFILLNATKFKAFSFTQTAL